MPVIKPSIGRRVLLFVAASAAAAINNPSVPFDAGIAYVWGDSDDVKNTINVGYTDHAGAQHGLTSVPLYDRAQDTTDAHGKGESYAVWMPYQFDQAQRALQPKVASGGQRPADMNLDERKLEDNGVATELGLERAAEAQAEANGGAAVAEESAG